MYSFPSASRSSNRINKSLRLLSVRLIIWYHSYVTPSILLSFRAPIHRPSSRPWHDPMATVHAISITTTSPCLVEVRHDSFLRRLRELLQQRRRVHARRRQQCLGSTSHPVGSLSHQRTGLQSLCHQNKHLASLFHNGGIFPAVSALALHSSNAAFHSLNRLKLTGP